MPLLHKAEVRQLFDHLAPEYADGRDRQQSFLAQKRIVLDMLKGARGRLLDIGCGPAVMEADLLWRGFEVTGIDMSLEMLRLGLRRLAEMPLRRRCRLLPGDVERLEFENASFEAVVCMGVLEYLPDYSRALAEIARVLRPGGAAVITIPNRVSPLHLALAAERAAKRLLGRPAPSFIPNRCLPWRLARELRSQNLHLADEAHCGAQYIVKATLAHP